MKLTNAKGDAVNFGDAIEIIKGVQKGSEAKIIQIAKNNLLKVHTPLGFRIYSPNVLGLKWSAE